MTRARAGAPPILVTCVGVEHDLELLPHFLEHYLGLGVDPDCVRPVINARDAADPGIERARALFAERDVRTVETWIAPYTSDAMWRVRRELQSRLGQPDRWILSADVDELHDYPEPLHDFLARMDALGVDAVQGPFVDRLAPGGRLAPVEPEPSIFDQFPIPADVIWSLAGSGAHHDRFGTVKLMAVKGRILPNRGGHDPLPGQSPSFLYRFPLGGFPGIETPDFRFRLPARVDHFHWTRSLPDRLRARLATPGVSPAGAEYGRKQLEHLERHDGVDLAAVATAPPPDRRTWLDELGRVRREGGVRRAAHAVGGAVRGLRPRIRAR